MAQVTLKGTIFNTIGNLPLKDSTAPEFSGVKSDLSETGLSDFKGKKVILNIFPSIDTGTCAASVRRFNKELQDLENTVVLCVSADLPFAQGRFCAAEGLENVITLSIFREPGFGVDYGVKLVDGPLQGLMSRAVVVVDTEGKVIYTQQVPEIVDEPVYSEVLDAVKSL